MRILFLTQYYPPEVGAAQNRISDLAQRLADFGHLVTVITALPNYPRGKIFEQYGGRLLTEEQVGGVRVIRTWIYASERRSFARRLASYFSFLLASMLAAAIKTGRCEIVIVESPPLFLGLAGVFVSRWKRAKLVFNVSDLWPASAVALDVLRNKHIIRLSTNLEEWIYRKSHLVTGQTQSIIDDIAGRIETPTFVYTNGIDPGQLQVEQSREVVRTRFGIRVGDFVVGYAGLHGLAQGVDVILSAAERLTARNDIVFALWGDGPEKASLLEFARARHLSNVRFFPPQPKFEMPGIMSAMDASIVPLKNAELFKGVIPNKLFESMGSGVPVIATMDGEVRRLVERAGGGICIPPEDPSAMATVIVYLKEHPDRRLEMGRSGKRFVTENYDRRVIAKSVEQRLSSLKKQRPSRWPVSEIAAGS